MRWYLKYPISYRNLQYTTVDYPTIYMKNIQESFIREFNGRCYAGSWRVDENYIKIKDKWKYSNKYRFYLIT